jgi:hypothetical protein
LNNRRSQIARRAGFLAPASRGALKFGHYGRRALLKGFFRGSRMRID